MRRIVGVIGQKGHGKDSVASFLINDTGFRRIAFADPVKDIGMEIFGLSYEQCYGPIELKEMMDKRIGLSPRSILQGIGTECGRRRELDHFAAQGISAQTMRAAFDRRNVTPNPDVWIQLAEQKIAISSPEYKWVFSDVRFQNEADTITRMGGLLLRVERPGFSTGTDEVHASEQELLTITPNIVLTNDRTLAALRIETHIAVQSGWTR